MTDTGLQYLNGFTDLRLLDLSGTKVTQVGLTQLNAWIASRKSSRYISVPMPLL